MIIPSTIEEQGAALQSQINHWLTKQCDHASVRRALRFPATGKAVVTRIRGAFWAGTVQSEYCTSLGKTYEEAVEKLNSMELK